MARFHPPIEPYDSGRLDVGDGQAVYWETCGNPDGKPALVLHGGPGSGCNVGMRRLFDPEAWRIVLFDQRGSGRSLPHAGDPTTSLEANTTAHLLADIEALRTYLCVERWMIYGASWGSTLGLAYAEAHPGRVSEMALSHVTTTTPAEIDWLYHGLGRFFPDAWDRFRAGAGVTDPGANLVEAYARLLNGPDCAVRERAARDWCDWEDAIVSVETGRPPNPRYADPRFRMAFARIVTHYFSHQAWLEDGVLLRQAHRLARIPGVLIHGRLDLEAPLSTAWSLSRAWPGCELIVVDGAGHETTTPAMGAAILDAIDQFAGRG
jgi:proline iminopeptidase